MKNKLLILCFAPLLMMACGNRRQETSWKYIGSYYCNYDVYSPSFHQTQTSVQVYFRPGRGNIVYYGVEDDSGNILEQWAGPSAMSGFGTVNFNNFKRGNDIGVVTLSIRSLPCQYWPED